MFKWTTEVKSVIIDYESIYDKYGNIDLSILPHSIKKVILHNKSHSFIGLDESDLLYIDTPSHFLIETLVTFLNKYNENSSNIIFISANFDDVLLYQQKRFGSILIENLLFDYRHISSAPDLMISTWEELKDIDFQKFGYSGELSASNIPFANGYFLISKINEFEIYSSGRYYKSQNQYLSQDVFSLKIINFKKINPHYTTVEMMSYLYCLMIELAIQNGHSFNSIISVPNRPDQLDRFKKTRDYICSRIEGLEDCTHNLICIKDYKSQKECTAEERAENIRNAFRVNTDFNGKDIILIDDVITTGSTVVEICKLLKEHHANSVCIFTLAVNQLLDFNFIQQFKNIQCPECEGKLILKFNTYTGEIFFGCSRYNNGCKHNCSLQDGLKSLKTINQYQPVNIPLDFEY